MKDRYDIIVVGGGPAGSTAARVAAENGASVLLLEKDREIGVPVRCAEAVGEKGIKKVVELRDEWIANKIEAIRLVAPNGSVVKVSHEDVGFVLDRKKFDYDLAEMAAIAGAEVVTKAYVYDLLKENGYIAGVRVKHLGEDFEIRAKVVLGADGVESRVGRWAGLKTSLNLKDIETCAQMTVTNLNIERQYCDFYFTDKGAPGGYLWVFPKNENNPFEVVNGLILLPSELESGSLDTWIENTRIEGRELMQSGAPWNTNMPLDAKLGICALAEYHLRNS